MKQPTDQFRLSGEVVLCEPYGSGHINDTYRVVTDTGVQYILQRINTHVFPNVQGLMDNITRVTAHLQAQAKNPRAKAANQASSAAGKAPASVTQRAVAPIAARSDRFTARDFQPRRSGSVSGRKCTPATSISVVTANTLPGVGTSSAQSSPGPSRADGVGRVK